MPLSNTSSGTESVNLMLRVEDVSGNTLTSAQLESEDVAGQIKAITARVGVNSYELTLDGRAINSFSELEGITSGILVATQYIKQG